MEAKDLRIGNYVYNNGRLDQIKDGHDIDHVRNNPNYPHNPIPLTEEWLLKFGFEKLEGRDDTFFFQLNNVQITDYNVSGYDYDSFNIKHVHQLQNLYSALTNEELKITKL